MNAPGSSKGVIEIDASEIRSISSQNPITIRSTIPSQYVLTNSIENSQNMVKNGSQTYLNNNNFYETMPLSMPLNLSISQAKSGIGVGIPYTTLLSKGSRVIVDNKSVADTNKSNEKDDKELPRIKRMNIPQITLINTKTREVIDPVLSGRGEVGNQHVEDKQIVQRLNRLLIEGEWGYSSLFGKENRKSGQYSGEKNPRDLDFPSVMGLVSKQMKENFKNYGADFVNLVQCQHKVKLVHETMTFGLTPNNSRYFVFGIFTLSKNLDPILLALGFAKDQVMQTQRDDAYHTLLKAFIESNNEELTQERRQRAARRKLLGKRGKQPELIPDNNYLFPEIIFCNTDKDMQNATTKIKQEYGVSFDIHHSYQQRFQVMKKRFERHQIKKDKSIMGRAEHIIRKMIQSSNPHDVKAGIGELCTYNGEFQSRYKRFGLEKHCLINYQKRFVGFHVFERFQIPMINYLSNLIIQRNGNLLKNFIENVLRKEQAELKKPPPTYEDRYELLKFNSRLRKLMNIVQPNVLIEFLEQFRIGKTLKEQKMEDAVMPTYVVGLGKRNSKMQVYFKHQSWKCECGYLSKIGIPCPHLMRVLHIERKFKFEDYINPRYFKVKIPGEIQILEDQ